MMDVDEALAEVRSWAKDPEYDYEAAFTLAAEVERLRAICDEEANRVAWWIAKAQDVTDRWRTLTPDQSGALEGRLPYGLADALDELGEHGHDEDRHTVVKTAELERLRAIETRVEDVRHWPTWSDPDEAAEYVLHGPKPGSFLTP